MGVGGGEYFWMLFLKIVHDAYIRQENEVRLENDYVLVSTPSGIHSHKPPLWPVLRDLGILKIDDQCLEIFGRYLLPNTVTVGNQCLIFQDKDVFFVSKLDTYTLFTRANLLVEYQGQSN